MSQRIEASAEIDAPVEEVFQVVADVTRYPEFLPGVQGVAQEDDVFEMTVRLGPVDVSWKSRALIQPYESIAVRLVEGPFEQMDVCWTFSVRGDSTEVRCVTEYALLLPIPGIRHFARRAIAANTRATIEAFRRRVRALRDERG